ncbi:ATP-binding cassette sub-family C protein [Babesia gibsoni]|uniref:ATP-binding cassette sub-family C protein n=1 Tax=Babesia gibsoni TaxID=33632 RepID=A0AAD8PG54_BABGI|nr:ATP-binding cassette sub-family C protein [Babesia gibsoni]
MERGGGMQLSFGLPPSLRQYDDKGLWSFLFLRWVRPWINFVNGEAPTLSSLHPLPKADQITLWQPIFSKHISDGVLHMEKVDVHAASKGEKRPRMRYRSIFLRAMVATFWKRALIAFILIVIVDLMSVGTSICMKFVIYVLSNNDRTVFVTLSTVLLVVLVEVAHNLVQQHMIIFMNRLEICMEASIAITLFQHGLCHRRHYSVIMDDLKMYNSCKRIVHQSGKGSDTCSSNPLFCPAQRHQNRELPPSMFIYMVHDASKITFSINAIVTFTSFIISVTASIIYIKTNMNFPILYPALTICLIVVTMIFIEIVNGSILKYNLESMDYRISVTSQVMGNLKLAYDMGIEDVGYRAIEDSRNDELSALKARLLLIYLNRVLERAISVLLYWVFIYAFNEVVMSKDESEYDSIDVNAPIALLFMMFNIATAGQRLPRAIRTFIEAVTSYRRVEEFIRKCSPNYYLDISNKNLDDCALELDVNDKSSQISDDTVVYFKGASFSHIYTRQAILKSESLESPLLKSMDFELKRGEVRIVTGPQGCGKTSFIKSILGEMSLVSGSMAVAPLSTGMPIFYTSQEVWLPTDSIRAIITFGYAFDEEIYNEVVRCAELLRDFSSWDDGDMRVISEKGYSLSGGQRVRVSLARALYAYMVFSKANESLENNRCCFLMCLDEPFNGLDVNVATAIFNNLFNKETGLLVRDDVAIVMAMSMMSVDITLKNVWWNDVLDMSIYTIEGGVLSQRQSLNKNVMEKKCGTHENVENGSLSRRFTSFSGMSSRQFSMVVEPPTRLTTNVSNHDKYGMQQLKVALTEKDNVINTWIGYCVYLKAVGYIMFTIFVLLAMFSNISSNMVLVFLQKWTDNIKMLSENSTISGKGVSECMERHRFYYSWITVLATCALTSAFILAILLLVISMRGARRLHKFALDSIFQKPSSEIPLKSNLSTLMTFITADIYIIGEFIGSDMYETIFAVFYCAAKLLTLCYLFPLAVPITLLVCMLLYVFFHRMYLKCARILQRMMLESNSNINEVYNEVISGSAIYRSFRKEYQWMDDIRHRSDEYYRTKFLKFTGTSWVSLVSKLSMSVMIAVMICISMLRSYIFGTDINVARLGIGMSLCVSIGSSVKTCLNNYSQLERQMCSVVRFENYFLQGRFSLKDRFESMGECILSGFYSHYSGNFVDDKVVRGAIITRRTKEYRNFMFRRYISLLDCIFKRLKIEVIKDSNYFSDTRTSLELKEVSVPVPTGYEVSNKSFILSKISCVGRAGEVIGIVGRTGAGKSTLLNVMQNMVYNRMGSVLLSGTDMSNIPRNVLRHLIGVLPQLPFVLKGWTLRRFLDPRMLFTDDDIYSALDCCGLLDMVHSVTDGKGLNTILALEDVDASRNLFVITPLIPLRSKGRESFDYRLCMSCKTKPKGRDYEALFSPMQMRQLWFARLVLYRHSYKVILLDEPPSNNCAADENNETQGSVADQGLPVYDIVRLYFSHCITFIVAHDKKAITYCNRLWLLENGGLQEDCTIDEFLRRDLMRYTSIRET